MSEMIIQRESLVAMANAIREFTGETKLYSLDEIYEKLCPDFIYKLTKDEYQFTSIPEGITKIGNGAFSGNTKLSLTSLPDSILTIGESAFSNCPNLALTSLPQNLTSIGPNAFAYCPGLTLTSLPESLTSIDSRAFGYCSGLISVFVPDSVINIDDDLFWECENLTKVSLPKSINNIDWTSFFGCSNLTELTLSGKPNISADAFLDNTKLTTINVSWSEGEVANAPWGAINATINYNYVEDGRAK